MRLINLDKLLDDIHRTVKESGLVNHECEIMDCIKYADVIDTDIEAEPVRHGKWIFGETKGHSWMKCNQCLKSQSGHTACFAYCPDCGAKMDLND